MQKPDVTALAAAVAKGDRRALARAITLVETSRPDLRASAEALLSELCPPPGRTLRIGLTGTPGVGKSTFIEAFGSMLTARGHRVAVLAVDPSSARTGGSILGDKTRMDRLARDPAAFIRPSPSRAELGGVAPRTREAIRLCESAGYDIVLVETVGVGQSETLAAGMTDLFVLLIAPAGGDELQGVKRGILEVADIVLVTKADGDLADAARRTLSDYGSALRLFRRRSEDPAGFPAVLPVSAASGTGLVEAWSAMAALAEHRRQSGAFAERRGAQARLWFEEEIRLGLMARLGGRTGLGAAMDELGESVACGARQPVEAATELLDRLFPSVP